MSSLTEKLEVEHNISILAIAESGKMFGAVKKLISSQVQEHGCGTRVSSADRQAGLLVGH